MRILYIDADSLRPDHLGCYGYHRNTSPNIDRIAAQAVRFDHCYTSDAPCLPSRTALVTGRFGIHTGVVNHGGTAAEPVRTGPSRGFASAPDRRSLFECLSRAGFQTTSISPFPPRHGAWHFLAGIDEYHNTGRFGNETADEVNRIALPWLQAHARQDSWFLHVNYWDPHRPYRTPADFGEPFAHDPPPAWLTEEIRQRHWAGCRLQSAQDPNDGTDHSDWPRMPRTISSLDEYRRWIDGYDTGIRYMDDHIGQLLDVLEAQGVLDETAIIVSADHGENQGELNYYGAHRTGDLITHHVPLLIRWPGRASPGQVRRGLHYHLDVSATILDLLGIERPALWHGCSFAADLSGDGDEGQDYLVLSQMACMCQRSVRFDNWILLRTYHDGFSRFPPLMLFDVENDPHELRDLAEERPEVVNRGLRMLEEWHSHMMATFPAADPVDPLQIVVREGPLHANDSQMESYCRRLRATGRGHHAGAIEHSWGRVSPA